ncbi:hypothetical protein [Parasulfitobacter algicola]|uniref:Uncharacterized protein n=1 Tax=Parasulfitobacter algicola TaxID=2614809 RepID=A0ABX2J1A6_9RHOB|nr:hypothetical protein [Sulfitobacter algicola]NSX57009.1 hypothetical protein [Sulfitobacter algicola]
MVEFTKEELDAFLSKKEFDFETVAGRDEFFEERRIGGGGRDSDGFQLRDIKNYAVGVANIISSGASLRGGHAEQGHDGRQELYVAKAGRTITLEAGDQIKLVCGQSRITMKSNGTIEVNGKTILEVADKLIKLNADVVKIN